LSGKRSLGGRRRRGLPPKLSPAQVAQALDATATTIIRIVLTFVGAALFCFLSLLTPDSALLTAGERLNVPFAGPVSFLGFIFVGPAVLIALRVCLEIYADHWRRLEAIRRRLPLPPRAPALVPLRNRYLQGFTWVARYLLLPAAMLDFTWKAAVFPDYAAGLLCATVAVVVGHVLLLRASWWAPALLSVGAALVGFFAATAYSQGTISQGLILRPFNLFRAELSNQWLVASDLRGAILARANLAGAELTGANLAGANLQRANLAGAELTGANLAGANLWGANLKGANLQRANLVGEVLGEANLASAELTGANLASAELAGTNLASAELTGANLASAELAGTNLAGANLWGADLAGAELTGADLTDALLSETRFAGEGADPARHLTQAQIDRAWAWADYPPLDLDRLASPLALPEAHLCDPALRPTRVKELDKRPQGERHRPPAGCSGAAGAGAAR
jgi:hypothetical protein